jgi:hypothetical protein
MHALGTAGTQRGGCAPGGGGGGPAAAAACADALTPTHACAAGRTPTVLQSSWRGSIALPRCCSSWRVTQPTWCACRVRLAAPSTRRGVVCCMHAGPPASPTRAPCSALERATPHVRSRRRAHTRRAHTHAHTHAHTPTELQADVFEGVWQPWMQQRGYHSLHNPRPPAAGSSITGPQDGVSLHFRSAQFKCARVCCALCAVCVLRLAATHRRAG